MLVKASAGTHQYTAQRRKVKAQESQRAVAHNACSQANNRGSLKAKEERKSGEGLHFSILILRPIAAITPQRQDGFFNQNLV